VPPGVLAAKDEALSNAYILTARSYIRSKRYLLGLKKLYKGLYLYLRNLSVRTGDHSPRTPQPRQADYAEARSAPQVRGYSCSARQHDG